MKTHALILVECHDSFPDAKVNGKDAIVFGDEVGRIVLASTDFTTRANKVNDIDPALLIKKEDTDLTQLTAPGEVGEEFVRLYSAYGYFVKVANINTNVVVRIETTGDTADGWGIATLKNTDIPNCAITNNQMTITANGIYPIWTIDPAVKAKLVWVSESGGTDAVLDQSLFFRRA